MEIKIRPQEPTYLLQLPKSRALELYVHLRESSERAVDKQTEEILLEIASDIKQFLLSGRGKHTDVKEN